MAALIISVINTVLLASIKSKVMYLKQLQPELRVAIEEARLEALQRANAQAGRGNSAQP
ncbi:hypothetical protein [Corynebacterium accolens]|uniref:hypothetical protein n=1 Tax=Corynebacterium accolens TaxID=38284 RepID=UPI00266F1BFE|nr:hypothetical protein [Corynebacterium accolens]WKS54937.1 hypothetical protein NLL31_06810 [Corynebacterium accolens]